MLLESSITSLVQDLRAHKLRALLTVCGIAWGMAGIVLLLAFGEGVRRRTMERQHGLGDGVVMMWPSRTTRPFAGNGAGRKICLRVEDVLRLSTEIPQLEVATPEYCRSVRIAYGSKARTLNLAGIYPAFRDLRHIYPQQGGRFIDEEDIIERRQVIFLGDMVCKELFGTLDPVGCRVTVNQMPFKVVGRLQGKRQDTNYGGRDAWKVFIPATTFAAVFGQEQPDMFIYRSANPTVHAAVSREVYEALGRLCQFEPGDVDAFTRWDTSETNRFLYYFFLGLNLLMGVGGTFTLIVGGIGVANLMFITVRERTREMGIKMAIGARPGFILLQYLTEALLLTLAGGLLGLAISWAITRVAASASFTEQLGSPVISPGIVALSLFLLGGIGTLAGWFPARKAANMEPVEALGYSS